MRSIAFGMMALLGAETALAQDQNLTQIQALAEEEGALNLLGH